VSVTDATLRRTTNARTRRADRPPSHRAWHAGCDDRSTMPLPIHTTMLELVLYLSAVTATDREVVARVTELVNGGVVVLRGNFAGRRIE